MTRPLVSDEVLDDWHPLSGLLAPEYIPPEWDGPHVGKRLAEALRTLRHLPMNGHPKAFGNSWPEYQIERTDELAQTGADAIQRAQEEASRNRVKVFPPRSRSPGWKPQSAGRDITSASFRSSSAWSAR
jgi:hypothetical protein